MIGMGTCQRYDMSYVIYFLMSDTFVATGGHMTWALTIRCTHLHSLQIGSKCQREVGSTQSWFCWEMRAETTIQMVPSSIQCWWWDMAWPKTSSMPAPTQIHLEIFEHCSFPCNFQAWKSLQSSQRSFDLSSIFHNKILSCQHVKGGFYNL